MKVKVHLRVWKTQERIYDRNTKQYKLVEINNYCPDIKGIAYSTVEYNIDEGWVIIEIADEDYDKIKDKVIEVIEQ